MAEYLNPLTDIGQGSVYIRKVAEFRNREIGRL